jgi:glycosyltransferase involved in cell wall biosynthesis
MNPVVSVVIPVYNMDRFIKDAIGSVLSQTYTAFELIIIDDGSTDGTRDIINSIKDKRVRYYYQSNSGLPAKARNKGIGLSRGKHIALLDHDDIWMPEKLEKQVAILEMAPKIAIIATNAFLIHENTKTKTTLVKGMRTGYFNDDNFFPGSKVIQSSVLIKRPVYDETGGFKESPDMKALEDYDLWLRVYSRYPCYYINEPLVYYRRYASSTSGTELQIFERSLYHYTEYFKSYGFSKRVNNIRLSEILYGLSRVQFLKEILGWKKNLLRAYLARKTLMGLLRLMFFTMLPRQCVIKIYKLAKNGK